MCATPEGAVRVCILAFTHSLSLSPRQCLLIFFSFKVYFALINSICYEFMYVCVCVSSHSAVVGFYVWILCDPFFDFFPRVLCFPLSISLPISYLTTTAATAASNQQKNNTNVGFIPIENYAIQYLSPIRMCTSFDVDTGLCVVFTVLWML